MSTYSLTLEENHLQAFAKVLSKHKIEHCQVSQDGRPLLRHARNSHAEEKLHGLNSVTKSIVSLLIGIAIDRGDLPGVDVHLRDFLQAAPEDVTLRHLLTMSPGWDWPEWGDWGGRPFPMINSKDWVKFILAREKSETPGSRWRYDSGSSQLLSVVLQHAAGCTAYEYAIRHLFGPLGIDRHRWYANSKGYSIGGFGLELRAPDMLKIAELVLDKGMANGRRIVSEDWISASTSCQIATGNGLGDYGWHWWTMKREDGSPTVPQASFATGYGGQYIIVMPEARLIATIASSIYKNTFLPFWLFRKLVGV